jgi:flagellar protein FliS
MNPYTANPQAYRDASVMTASPEQLVVMLYDGALRFLRQARHALEEDDFEAAHNKLSRGEAIIDELLATLNMEAGEIAERLQAIYIFCKRCLMEARLERDPERIARVVALLGELREAWGALAARETAASAQASAQAPATSATA